MNETGFKCPKCGQQLKPSDVDGYEFVCVECDENFYKFEAVENPSETGFRCPKCGQTEEFDAFAVVLNGRTHITADGWNYYDFANDVELHSSSLMECCKCHHVQHQGFFMEEE